MLGGASAAGPIANAALHLLALILIALVLRMGAATPNAGAAAFPLRLLAAAALLIILQLVPLPLALWSHLPGRASVIEALTLSKAPPVWLPLSLAPDATIASLLALLPPLAMLLAVHASSDLGRTRMLATLVAVAGVSLLLGVSQRAGSPTSPLYLYHFTNRGSAVGLFANRNHLGTMLLCALPFLTALTPDDCAHRGTRAIMIAVAAIILAGGVVIVGSVAAIAMLPPVILVCAVLFLHGRRRMRWAWATPTILIVSLLTGAAALRLHGDGEEPGAASQHRSVIVPTTLHAARDFFPVGSGGGSFVLVYPFYEDHEAATPEYVNHAHSDYAEVALDYGLAGLAIIAAALVFWATRVIPVWRIDGIDGARARAALVALGIVAVASLVDYPMRTAALAALAGAATALLTPPRRRVATRPEDVPTRDTSLRISLMADKI